MLSSFESIFLINLDSREDRLVHAVGELTRVGFIDQVNRISGVTGNWYPQDPKKNACRGNHLSHAKCIEIAKEKKAANCLIFEDDVMFINNPNTVLPNAMQELPDEFDLFYLGANLESPCYKISDHLARLTFAFATHAYCISSRIYDEVLDICLSENTAHNDSAYNFQIVGRGHSYITIPILAIQYGGYSNIEGCPVNYSWMVERYRNNLRV